MRLLCSILVTVLGLLSTSAQGQSGDLALGQGLMAGEPTESSVILQTRLTRGDRLVDGDLPGALGVARFELATSDDFTDAQKGQWLHAKGDTDYIVKQKFTGLKGNTRYFYRVEFGPDESRTVRSTTARFKTIGGADSTDEVRIAIVTGMNYAFFHGVPPERNAEPGADPHVGFPGLEGIISVKPDYFVSTGDSVYYDQPGGERAARTQEQLRRKWHEQLVQKRFHTLLQQVGSWWEKDDHDFRFNDSDRTGTTQPSTDLGIATFREQLPVVDPKDPAAVTYRTHRVNRNLQIWVVEGRDYRSPNDAPDGPDKTIWGVTQRDWLKRTLKESDAKFKVLISATPFVGPDRANKIDSHADHHAFGHERDGFYKFLKDERLIGNGFYIVTGDRHWQYHSIDPSGIEEFSCGALTDSNSVVGVFPGEKRGTDPEALIKQPHHPKKAGGGFLLLNQAGASLTFEFYDTTGTLQYASKKEN